MPTIKNSASGTLLTYGANHLMKRLPDIYCTTKNEAKKAEADNKHNTQRDRALSSNQSHNADDINLDIVIKKMRDLLSDAQRKNLRLIIDKLPRAKILALYQQYQHSPQDFYNTILQQSQIQLKPQEPKPPEPTIDPVAVKVVEKDQSQQNILPQIAGDEKLDMLIEKVAAVKSPEESEKQSTAESGTEVENSAESAEKVNIPAKQ